MQHTFVELKHLRRAVLASQFGSLRKAADALGLKQSTLSRDILELERLVGATLFVRSGAGVRSTAARGVFLERARSIIEQMDALTFATRRAGRGEIGSLSIGLYTAFSSGWLRTAILDYKERHPKTEIAMVEKPKPSLFADLRTGLIDVLVVTGEVQGEDDEVLASWSERMFLVLPEDHALARHEVAYWTDLHGETILLPKNDLGLEFESVLISKLICKDSRPWIEFHDVRGETVKGMVSGGFGLSLVCESDIGATLPGTVYRELRDGSGPTQVPFFALCRKDTNNPALKQFATMLQKQRFNSSLKS
jgi:DNA-binding transcriptional LysR family regulator